MNYKVYARCEWFEKHQDAVAAVEEAGKRILVTCDGRFLSVPQTAYDKVVFEKRQRRFEQRMAKQRMAIEKEKCAGCGTYVLYLMGGQCAACIDAEQEIASYDAMSDADKAAYDAYHGDAAGWLTYSERMEQQRGY